MTAVSARPDVVDCSIEQRIRYDYSEPVRNLRQRLVVVPPARHGRQHRVDWALDVRGADADTVRTSRDGFGNVRIDIAAPAVTSWIEFEARSTIAFRDDGKDAGVRLDPRYARPTRLTAPDPVIEHLVAGCEGDAERISERVHAALTYEFGVTGVHTTAAEALAGGRGVCQDFAHVMVAACRLLGVPARYVSGHLVGEGGSHAWVEVLYQHPDHSRMWLAEAWDPTHCRRTDDRYITVATGRDYADVAPMSGTFSGRALGTLTVQKRARAELT